MYFHFALEHLEMVYKSSLILTGSGSNLSRQTGSGSETLILTTYKVFIKYCVLFQEFSIFCALSLARTGLLLLVVQKMASQ